MGKTWGEAEEETKIKKDREQGEPTNRNRRQADLSAGEGLAQ